MLRLLSLSPLLVFWTATGALSMELHFEWGATAKCFDKNSPPMTLSDVPRDTSRLKIRMVDLDATWFDHGETVIDFTGQAVLPYGAFTYRGPCPPAQHTYQMIVEAIDGDGRALVSASARRTFPE